MKKLLFLLLFPAICHAQDMDSLFRANSKLVGFSRQGNAVLLGFPEIVYTPSLVYVDGHRQQGFRVQCIQFIFHDVAGKVTVKDTYVVEMGYVDAHKRPVYLRSVESEYGTVSDWKRARPGDLMPKGWYYVAMKDGSVDYVRIYLDNTAMHEDILYYQKVPDPEYGAGYVLPEHPDKKQRNDGE